MKKLIRLIKLSALFLFDQPWRSTNRRTPQRTRRSSCRRHRNQSTPSSSTTPSSTPRPREGEYRVSVCRSVCVCVCVCVCVHARQGQGRVSTVFKGYLRGHCIVQKVEKLYIKVMTHSMFIFLKMLFVKKAAKQKLNSELKSKDKRI